MNENCDYCADGAQCALCDVSAVCADCCGCRSERLSTAYTYDSTGHTCQVCDEAPIDEYGCQVNMKDGEPVCVDCCTCPDHVADRSATWDESTVCVCDGCGKPMLPNVSTLDDDGCGWVCLSPACADYTANELEPDDLVAVGVPEWVARLVCGLVDELTAFELQNCPAHEGGYDCTPFCPICGGNQEIRVRN